MAHVFEFEVQREGGPDGGHRYDVSLLNADIIAVATAHDDLEVDRVAARLAYNVLRRRGLFCYAPVAVRLRLTLEYPDDEEYRAMREAERASRP
jgi:hypothetical protein